MTANIIFYKNDMLLELKGLKDVVLDTFVNGATVTATVVDSDGAAVTGQSFPVTLDFVANSDGDYRVVLDSTIVLVIGKKYTAQITAVSSGIDGYWELDLRAVIRGRP